jgi:hypothetical protein
MFTEISATLISIEFKQFWHNLFRRQNEFYKIDSGSYFTDSYFSYIQSLKVSND